MEKLDLHSIEHEDIEREVVHFIEDNWDSPEEIEIITGNSMNMKRTIKKILDEYKLKYKIGDDIGINNGFIRAKF
jgi:hypothetical protein